ncbi:sensor histidine kinase [Stutzerimonas stutzeri]|uniref:sensor histidine kinase n=2 Tax=Gammaproteobacteria TaxID=1236 RepID=UPI001EF5D397|nr:ATP-binding protein [Stutzerimonas stutzeri]MCS8842962.1 ATP-binding protein [Pseudomonas aeruginosa]CAB5556819.1 signal transduction histidine-protein kinase BaeS [Stutzerimonas stutzeri]CAB5599392.1 signal transduction histidine-protein kinase BaeS [Stutzerimonas stutzeri]CAC9116489.1 signal transduction histidine-protein kinase BaeS [Stutzerimonas stutzeri]HBP0366234.1 sensor histidine kinase [Pseudomonas aeruginosa]
MSEQVEWAQIFERYRHLSRDFQQKFQSIQSRISFEKYGAGDATIKTVREELEELDEIFQDFNSWIYISLLEDLNEAKKNNAVGLLEISSKIKRIKIKMQKKLTSKRIRIETNFDKPLAVSTYITFFEQLLNLIFENSFKYSPTDSSISVSTTNKSDSISLEISSTGPIVEGSEIKKLATKGFRAEAAISSKLPGEGYGLYNSKRIANLLGIEMSFRSSSANKFTYNGNAYCDFVVCLKIPLELIF